MERKTGNHKGYNWFIKVSNYGTSFFIEIPKKHPWYVFETEIPNIWKFDLFADKKMIGSLYNPEHKYPGCIEIYTKPITIDGFSNYKYKTTSSNFYYVKHGLLFKDGWYLEESKTSESKNKEKEIFKDRKLFLENLCEEANKSYVLEKLCPSISI